MALRTKNVLKRKNGTYNITVEDTSLQTGTTEKGEPIYQTFSVIHNPIDGDVVLEEKVNDKMKKLIQEQETNITLKSNIDIVLAKVDSDKV